MRTSRECAGFTYLGVLFIVALMGTLLAVAGESWYTASQREKERELLFIGDEFRDAIGLYFNRTPGAVQKYPRSLDDLLKDSRYLVVQRYLRKVYVDPMTGSKEWGLVKAADGGVAGVYSLSEQTPIKLTSFAAEDAAFENMQKYSDWKFIYRQRAATPQKPATPAPPPISQPK